MINLLQNFCKISHLKSPIGGFRGLLILFLISSNSYAQTLLETDGSGNTYELINSVFAPNGGDAVESAECAHPEFGRHIAEVWDDDLQKYVFEFYIHVAQDNDRCINFDRQRVEIKTYDASPDYLKGIPGETIVYKWRFKVPSGFKASSSFTHIHQIKAVGGDESNPLFTLTARKANPNKLELNYYKSSEGGSQKLTQANLSLFENTWVECTERIKLDNLDGTYSIVIKKVSDGTTVLSYNNNKMLTYRSDNTFIRPKWGIYRSLSTPSDLRDESLRFDSFSIYEEPLTNNKELSENKESFSFKFIGQNQGLLEFSLNESQNIKFELINLNGQLIHTYQSAGLQSVGKHQINLNIDGLKKGIYFARFTASNKVFTQKIITI